MKKMIESFNIQVTVVRLLEAAQQLDREQL